MRRIPKPPYRPSTYRLWSHAAWHLLLNAGQVQKWNKVLDSSEEAVDEIYEQVVGEAWENSMNLEDFNPGEKVLLARSPFPDRIGMKGTVVKTIKSRNVVRFLKDNPRSPDDTYDAWPQNLEKLK